MSDIKITVSVLVLVIFISAIFTFEQNDYMVASERFEFLMNEYYVKETKHSNYKYNRTHSALNVSGIFAVEFGRKLMANIQAYKFSSNEYRTFPMQFSINVCNAIEQNTFGLQNIYSTACGNPPKCPLVKGGYSVCKWQPDFRKFPPYIPPGSYRLDFNLTFEKNQVGCIQWFATVKRN